MREPRIVICLDPGCPGRSRCGDPLDCPRALRADRLAACEAPRVAPEVDPGTVEPGAGSDAARPLYNGGSRPGVAHPSGEFSGC